MQIRAIRKGKWAVVLLAAISLISLLAAACGGDSTTSTPTPANTAPKSSASVPASSPTAAGIPADVGKNDSGNVTGAGASFPAPIYQSWFDYYNTSVAKGVKVNYQSIGSGGGIKQHTEKTVDFGASDAPMSDAQLQAAAGTQHVPMVMGSVVVTYNLGDVQKLKFDGPTVAKIFLGEIKKWDDAAIKALNPDAKLPGADIQVAHRSDGSGTSYTFTDYLSKVSADWQAKVGTNANPAWPAGQGGKGNEGVTTLVKQTPNSIGYVELAYAIENKLPFADLKNKAGKFVTPSLEATSAAAAGVTFPEDYRISLTDASGDTTYPIVTATYLLVYKDMASCAKAKPLVNFMWWAFHDPKAAEMAKQLRYAPIPTGALPAIEKTLKSLKCEGKAILPG